MPEVALLLKDVQGDKAAKFWGRSAWNVVRGEILLLLPNLPKKDGKTVPNYMLAHDPAVTLYCDRPDITILREYQNHLLLPIKSREVRYQLFKQGLLEWGSKLNKGDYVYVRVPSESAESTKRVSCIIRFIGKQPEEGDCVYFGVEIQVYIACRML